MVHRLSVKVRFRLVSGVHTTGDQVKLWTDRVMVTDWKEGRRPVLPATTLKGFLRESAERILRGLGYPACDGSNPADLCDRCLVCEVFGSPRRRSPLRFFDANFGESITDVRMNVSLSRYRKTAYEERLFSTEIAWPKTFTACIEGWFDTPERARRAAGVLYLAARSGFAVGGARSRGLGWLELRDFEAFIDQEKLKHEDLVEESKGWLTSMERSV